METRRRHFEHVAVVELTADDLRGIGYALSPNDTGGQEMLEMADELDRLNGREVSP